MCQCAFTDQILIIYPRWSLCRNLRDVWDEPWQMTNDKNADD
jgi:hypothetical protein